MLIRVSQWVVIAISAGFFGVIALNNILDYDSNLVFVNHVLSMDTVFKDSPLFHRAIRNISIHKVAYNTIITIQMLAACLCLFGSLLFINCYQKAKKFGVFGLLAGIFLYGFGFMVIASEWFVMWQSTTWNAQTKAGMFLMILCLFLLILLKDDAQYDTIAPVEKERV